MKKVLSWRCPFNLSLVSFAGSLSERKATKRKATTEFPVGTLNPFRQQLLFCPFSPICFPNKGWLLIIPLHMGTALMSICRHRSNTNNLHTIWKLVRHFYTILGRKEYYVCMIFYFLKMESSAGISTFVAHMKEEAQHTAAREADLPVIFPKTWQAKKSWLSARSHTRHTSACHCSSPSDRRPWTAALRLALCPSLSRVSPFAFLLTCAHLPILHSHGNIRILIETWWEQKEFDGLHKRNLMEIA